MTERQHIVSYRCVSLEPTRHRTQCACCYSCRDDEVMYAMRLVWDNGDVTEWFFACTRCHAGIESKALQSKVDRIIWGGVNIGRGYVWNEEP